MTRFTIQFYNKTTGQQRGTGDIFAATSQEAIEKGRSSLEGEGWKVLSITRF